LPTFGLVLRFVPTLETYFFSLPSLCSFHVLLTICLPFFCEYSKKVLTEQMDLRWEAQNLNTLREHFAGDDLVSFEKK